MDVTRLFGVNARHQRTPKGITKENLAVAAGMEHSMSATSKEARATRLWLRLAGWQMPSGLSRISCWYEDKAASFVTLCIRYTFSRAISRSTLGGGCMKYM